MSVKNWTSSIEMFGSNYIVFDRVVNIEEGVNYIGV